jgi:hypothetical protein
MCDANFVCQNGHTKFNASPHKGKASPDYNNYPRSKYTALAND